MNKIRKILLLLGLPILAMAQTNTLTTTTLGQAVTSTNATIVYVASGTGIVGQSATSPGSFIYTDKEQMQVIAVNPPGTSGAAALTVVRGTNGTPATQHLTGMLVFVGPGNAFSSAPVGSTDPSGTCTLANIQYYPRIHLLDGRYFACSASGAWGYAGPSIGDPARQGSQKAVTTTYTATYWDYILEADPTSAGFTITLPSATALPGKVFLIINNSTSTNTITVTTAGGCASITSSHGACRIISNGTAWQAF